jgi:hypothetical protein
MVRHSSKNPRTLESGRVNIIFRSVAQLIPMPRFPRATGGRRRRDSKSRIVMQHPASLDRVKRKTTNVIGYRYRKAVGMYICSL